MNIGPTTSQKNPTAISHSSKGNYSESSLPSVRRLTISVQDLEALEHKTKSSNPYARFSAHLKLGDYYANKFNSNLNISKKAYTHYKEAIKINDKIINDKNMQSELTRKISKVLVKVGDLHYKNGRMRKAMLVYKEAEKNIMIQKPKKSLKNVLKKEFHLVNYLN